MQITTTSRHFCFQTLDLSQTSELLVLSILKCGKYSKLTFLKSCSASSLTCFIIFGGLPSSALILSTSKATNFKKKEKKKKNVYDSTNIIYFLFKLQNVNLKLKLRKKEKRKGKRKSTTCAVTLL